MSGWQAMCGATRARKDTVGGWWVASVLLIALCGLVGS